MEAPLWRCPRPAQAAPPAPADAIAARIAETAKTLRKPIVDVIMTNENWAGVVKTVKDAGIPVFDFPETGSRVLAAMVRYNEIQKRLAEKAAGASGNKAKAREILAKAPAGFISQAAAFEILGAYGIPAPAMTRIASGQVPSGVKFPVVLKVDSEQVVHKSDAGGVMLNIASDAELRQAVAKMASRFPGANCIVQEQCPKGTELIIGLKREPGVGPVLMFGLGGIYVEVLKDVSFRLAPVSEAGAARMIRADHIPE